MRFASHFRPLLIGLLGAFLWTGPLVRADQDALSNVDPRFRSPRATVRTFLIAINQTEDDPRKIEEAAACLDLLGLSPERRRDGDRYALELEYILRSTNIPTFMISDDEKGSECEIGEGKEIKLKLRRMADGRWLFDSKTLLDLPRMRLFLWQKALGAGSAKDTADVPAAYRSPYALALTFMEAFKKRDLDAAAKCLDLSEIPDPAQAVIGRELVFKLKEILDRSIYIIFQDLPDSSVGIPIDALVHPEGRITVERQVAGKRKGEWLFSKASVRSLDRLYDVFESKPLVPELLASGSKPRLSELKYAPGLWLRHRVPGAFGRASYLTNTLSLAAYQIFGMFLLVVLTVPVYRLVVWPLKRLGRALVRWRGVVADESEIAGWVRPLGWLAAIAMLIEGILFLDLQLVAAGWVLACLVPAFRLVLALAAYRLIDPVLKFCAGPALTQAGATTFATMGYPVLSLVLKIVVVVCGLAAVLELFEFDIPTVLAGLGIGGLAFALAAQDTLKNFFGSVLLIADRTFRVGDLVRIGADEGVVESVGIRSTRIRGLDDALLTIPNSDLTTTHVTNYGARRFRRFQTQFTVKYGTPPDRVLAFRDGILERIRQDPRCLPEKFEVAAHDLGASGIEILVRVFLDVLDGHAELAARNDLVLDILRLADRLGIEPLSQPTLATAHDPAPGS